MVRRHPVVFKAPSLSFSLKIALTAYALTQSIRFLTNLHQKHSISTGVIQILEEYSFSPTKAISTTTSRSRARKILSRRRSRISTLSYDFVNSINPLLLDCICRSNHTNNATTNCGRNKTSKISQIFDILNRDPQRIPSYIQGCPHLSFFGYVFRDLVNRLFPKPLLPFNPNKQKHTIIVSNDAVHASHDPRWTEQKDEKISKWHRNYGYNVAASIYMSSRSRGYPVQAIGTDVNENETVDDWWRQHSSQMRGSENGIWLAFFDPTDMNQQDGLFTKTAVAFINEASINYIVFRVAVSPDEFFGKQAAIHLLQAGYQLQILSSSHAGAPSVHNSKQSNYIFGPNKQIRSEEEVHNFFKHMQAVVTCTTCKAQDSLFTVYLFATRTMDLAIPTAHEYINLTGVETDDIVLNVDGDAIPFKTCRGSVAQISCNQKNGTTIPTQEKWQFKCVDGQNPNKIWFGGSTPNTWEVACVECPRPTKFMTGKKRLESTACVSRFLPDESTSSATALESGKPNILFILLEQVSRDRFEKFMPRTKLAIVNGGFGGFWGMEHYIATSTDPQHQKQLLSSGTKAEESLFALLQKNGYATLSAGNGCNASLIHYTADNASFHGSQLNALMCHEIPSRPNCIGGKSATDHLLDYTNNFLDFYRKNQRSWAAFLSFVEGREETGILPATIDGKVSNFVRQLRSTLTKKEWENTLIVVTSDTGATHGSFAHSFVGQQELVQPILYVKASSARGNAALKQNRKRYVTQHDLRRTVIETIGHGNQSLDFSSDPGISLVAPMPESRFHCNKVAEIPRSICDLLNKSSSLESLQKQISVQSSTPPSILAFYADIPKPNRNHIEVESKRVLPKRANVTKGCQCATNIEKWFPCDVHPWNAQSVTFFKEFFMLVDCPQQPTHLELKVFENHVLTKRSKGRLSKNSSKKFPNIIFLEIDSVSGAFADRHFPKTREFLKQFRVHRVHNGTHRCVDGVCSADFTERITLAGANSIPNQVAALSGCISSDFEHSCGIKEEDIDVNLYCQDPSEPHYGLQIHRFRESAKQIYWCPPQPGKEKRTTPWLFGITDSLGYINYFGEEFCYESSPYVTQGNVFPSFYSDISPHLVFCRLAELRIQRENADVPDEFRWGYEKQDQACVDSDASDCTFEKARISLDLIEKLWNVYPNHPKFAFLNVLAAHVYNADWSKVFLGAERYDDHLSSFLERMVLRADFDNTVIVVRSDHGLQRGPTAMNYNLQVEHTRPWTEILVPESLPGLSKKALFENQNRLTSGLDIYHTLRSLLDIQNPMTPLPPLPDWSYNLFSATVPIERTCHDARVDKDLCRERSIIPSFGICNTLDPRQKKFCRDYEVQPVVSPKDLPPTLPMPRIKVRGQAIPSNMTINITKIKEVLLLANP